MKCTGSILIADDEQDFLTATAGLLRMKGFRCDCVMDAASAAEQLRSTEYDLLISDIEMPGNSNLALIREVPQLSDGLPIILATGRPSLETAIESFQLSVVAYLVKPIDPKTLIETAAHAIERFQAYRAIGKSRKRLQDSCVDLQRLEILMRAESGNSHSIPWNAFPSMTLQQIVDSLHDLERYTQAISLQKTGPHESSAALLSAVHETIAVLEKTKNAFKSKDLGELRRRLETLVEVSAKQSAKKG